MDKIPFVKPWIDRQEWLSLVNKIELEHIGSSGPNSINLEKYFEKKLNATRALLVGSCTHALEISLLSLNLNNDDEIICPSYTFVSTVNSIVKAGAKAVFVDIEPMYFGLDPNLVEKAITDRTKAVLLVHYGGQASRVEEIKKICTRYKIKLIEDAAQAFYVKQRNRYLGTFGDLGCFSFHYTKNVTSGEGGLLVIPDNNESLADICEEIKSFGTNRNAFLNGKVDKYEWQRIGGSYFMTDIQAALLKSQIKKYPKILTERKKIYQIYYKTLVKLKTRQIRISEHTCNSNYHLFWILCRSLKERNELLTLLQKNGIAAASHFEPLHLSPFVKRHPDKFRIVGNLEVTITIAERILRLPIYPTLSNKDVKRICSIVLKYYDYN